ncbi:7-carboxy-7-deazaguanine synthase QueE [Candidatus Pantoea carbekii]|uniref:7-carboxy-7-deazaguanine synthase n=1 Tax=Candidatus Pantoea carbekii TaxID=1235990 RepID=U3U201_9GAMM|nr:7-carboxy-7-deazaguanine synthase QueE [Candidatus Pantoea carbekii]AKC32411.1 organic radical Activating YgcF [Candidatus Pantoea carbekii]BAO00136.1 YgcF protein [Candidatus Pantoea carbekii]
MFYPINEIFQTLQGEGFYTGVPSLFIRLQGCPICCTWCDTKYTWKKLINRNNSLNAILLKKVKNDTWSNADLVTLIDTIQKKGWTARHVVITGGEPAIYDLYPLTHALEGLGFHCQIETSGTHKLKCSHNTWVTVSPKVNMHNGYPVLDQTLQRADEIKYPVLNAQDLEVLKKLLLRLGDSKKRIIALQPISLDETATKLCIKTCIDRNWLFSIQMHKYINIS